MGIHNAVHIVSYTPEPDPHKFEYKQIHTLTKSDCLGNSAEQQVVRSVSLDKEEFLEVVGSEFQKEKMEEKDFLEMERYFQRGGHTPTMNNHNVMICIVLRMCNNILFQDYLHTNHNYNFRHRPLRDKVMEANSVVILAI